MILGSLVQRPVREIWNGQESQLLRKPGASVGYKTGSLTPLLRTTIYGVRSIFEARKTWRQDADRTLNPAVTPPYVKSASGSSSCAGLYRNLHMQDQMKRLIDGPVPVLF